ncbi:hypothetical protein FA95DRAFT_1606142 [Auriscalpium vulgare]|uniref:Uncharacterized protein n=1 Tax=Auriscalpium vulgare TaxID=40419 RepID=A0ACB8RTV2_9AGAM|nr:hypothetical protein FA95DRAFT_1606142 [Auriscalpium vulgare]
MATSEPKIDFEALGMDADLCLKISLKAKPDPITGEVDSNALMRHIQTNLDDPDVKKLLEMGSKAYTRIEAADISDFDFTSLGNTIVPNSVWMASLEYSGMVDANHRPLDPAKAATTPGSQHQFTLSCEAAEDEGRDRSSRFMKAVFGQGPPKSADVLDFMKRSIINPMPLLPNFLLFSIKFEPHMPALRLFLDTLPKPFAYQVETPALAERLHNISYIGSQFRYEMYVALADEAKKKGNAAFAARDRTGALNAYKDAIDHLSDALRQTPDDKQEAAAKKQLAVCLANRAATHLLEGDGMDAAQALEDGKAAEKLDPTYPKGYHRQARAHELLGQIEEARQVLERALELQDLRNREALVDALKALPAAAQNA